MKIIEICWTENTIYTEKFEVADDFDPKAEDQFGQDALTELICEQATFGLSNANPIEAASVTVSEREINGWDWVQ